MAKRSLVFLMYHELESPGRPLCHSEAGYVRYVIQASAFQSQIDWLLQNNWRGLSVTEALQYPTGNSVAITFDDGCETDFITAAPILQKGRFSATFYITAGRIGQPGYLSAAQLRQLGSSGFEIGCHSMTHAYLNGLQEHDLRSEVLDARKKLEDLIGKPIEHFSCPGGRYDSKAVAAVREAGYLSMATSHPRANSPATGPMSLGRVPILRDLDEATFASICTGQGLRKMRLAESVRGAARTLLGNTLYDRFRALLLS
jgi:peptidoglycan/xylan/chitin deacetylase (PgdA/CDA1 family)